MAPRTRKKRPPPPRPPSAPASTRTRTSARNKDHPPVSDCGSGSENAGATVRLRKRSRLSPEPVQRTENEEESDDDTGPFSAAPPPLPIPHGTHRPPSPIAPHSPPPQVPPHEFSPPAEKSYSSTPEPVRSLPPSPGESQGATEDSQSDLASSGSEYQEDEPREPRRGRGSGKGRVRLSGKQGASAPAAEAPRASTSSSALRTIADVALSTQPPKSAPAPTPAASTSQRAPSEQPTPDADPIVISDDSDDDGGPAYSNAADGMPTGRKNRAYLDTLNARDRAEVLKYPLRDQQCIARLFEYSRDPRIRLLPSFLGCERCRHEGRPCYIWINPLATPNSLYRRPCLTCHHKKCAFSEQPIKLRDPASGWRPTDKDELAASELPRRPPMPPPPAKVQTKGMMPTTTHPRSSQTFLNSVRTSIRPRPASPDGEPPNKVLRRADGSAMPMSAADASETGSFARPPLPLRARPQGRPSVNRKYLEAKQRDQEEQLREHARRQAKAQLERQAAEASRGAQPVQHGPRRTSPAPAVMASPSPGLMERLASPSPSRPQTARLPPGHPQLVMPPTARLPPSQTHQVRPQTAIRSPVEPHPAEAQQVVAQQHAHSHTQLHTHSQPPPLRSQSQAAHHQPALYTHQPYPLHTNGAPWPYPQQPPHRPQTPHPPPPHHHPPYSPHSQRQHPYTQPPFTQAPPHVYPSLPPPYASQSQVCPGQTYPPQPYSPQPQFVPNHTPYVSRIQDNLLGPSRRLRPNPPSQRDHLSTYRPTHAGTNGSMMGVLVLPRQVREQHGRDHEKENEQAQERERQREREREHERERDEEGEMGHAMEVDDNDRHSAGHSPGHSPAFDATFDLPPFSPSPVASPVPSHSPLSPAPLPPPPVHAATQPAHGPLATNTAPRDPSRSPSVPSSTSIPIPPVPATQSLRAPSRDAPMPKAVRSLSQQCVAPVAPAYPSPPTPVSIENNSLPRSPVSTAGSASASIGSVSECRGRQVSQSQNPPLVDRKPVVAHAIKPKPSAVEDIKPRITPAAASRSTRGAAASAAAKAAVASASDHPGSSTSTPASASVARAAPRPKRLSLQAYRVLGVRDPDCTLEMDNPHATHAIYEARPTFFSMFPGETIDVLAPFDRDNTDEYDPVLDLLRPSDLPRVPFLRRLMRIDEDFAAVIKNVPGSAFPDPEEEGQRLLPPYLYKPQHPCVQCSNKNTPCVYGRIRAPPPVRAGGPPPLMTLLPLGDCLGCAARGDLGGCVHLIQMAEAEVHVKLQAIAHSAPYEYPEGDDSAGLDESAVWFDTKNAVIVNRGE